MKQFIAGKNEEGVRLSRFVQNVTTAMPNSMLYKSFRNKRIKVNGKKALPDTRLNEKDVIELYINDEFFIETKTEAPKPIKSKYALEIIYEDTNIAIIHKPAHLLCHSDRTGDVSLVDLLCEYLQETGEYNPETEASFAPAVCNRLDRGTEGLVIAAKNYAALRDMNAIIRDDLVCKEYLCITIGSPLQGRDIAYLRHEEKNNKVTVRKNPTEGFKQIITEMKTLRTVGSLSLCKINLITGRTHQIRAHLAFLGAPVLGDIKYGNRKMNERLGFKTQALCAAKLTFLTIPPENILHSLSHKVISIEKPNILAQFEQLANDYNSPKKDRRSK